MEEPGGLQSMGSLGVGHDWATSLSLLTFMHWRGKWQPTPVFLPGESQGRGAWRAAVYGVAQSRTQLKWLSSSTVTISRAIWKWPSWYHVILFICSDKFRNHSKICSVLLSEGKLCLISFIFLIHTFSLTCPVPYKLSLSKLSHCEKVWKVSLSKL